MINCINCIACCGAYWGKSLLTLSSLQICLIACSQNQPKTSNPSMQKVYRSVVCPLKQSIIVKAGCSFGGSILRSGMMISFCTFPLCPHWINGFLNATHPRHQEITLSARCLSFVDELYRQIFTSHRAVAARMAVVCSLSSELTITIFFAFPSFIVQSPVRTSCMAV